MKKVIIFREHYEHLPARFASKIEHDLKCILDKGIPGLKKIYLFGSCARGEVRSSSDVDLLIVTEKKIEDRVLAADIRWTLDETLDGVRTDVVYMNEETEPENSVFRTVLERDRKLILEVEE